MIIKIKVGDVEIYHEQETIPKDLSAATSRDGYSYGNQQTQLTKTIKEIAELANELNEKLYN